MKADTVLEYVEFQLSTHRNRCELFVSGGGVTEKLASGFLKPFLIHLRALKDQITSQTGRESVIRLDHPQNSNINAASWFTKGILDRFVRFVSTPEVLERVRSIEDELAQLEQVRSIQVATLVQDGGTSFGTYPGFANNDSTAIPKDSGTCKLSKGYSHRAMDSVAAASKMELLEAMDIRLRALKQEQDTYFSRAAVAGFDSENMAGLVAFSEHFGAERLRAACLNFLEVLQKRHLERLEMDSEGISTNSATAMTKTPGNHFIMEKKSCLPLDTKVSQGMRQKVNDGLGDVGGDKNCPTLEKGSDVDSSLSKGSATVEGRKRWGPPENICRKVFLEQTETDSMASNDTSGGITLEDIASDAQSHSILQQARDLQEDLSERRRNPCSTEKSTPDHKNNVECQGKPHKQDSIVDEPMSEKHKNNENATVSVIEHARRLSVQDAISLFEKNQRRDSTDTGGKSSGGKLERSRVSLEGSNTSSSAEMATRRRSTLGGLETTVKTQENHILTENESSFSMQNAVLNLEGASHPAHPPGNSANQSSESDWRKQFKLQLERTLSKELVTDDVAIKQDALKFEIGEGIPQNLANFNLQAASTSSTSSRTITSLQSRSTAKHGVSAELRGTPLLQDNTPVNSDHFMESLDPSHMQRTFDSDSCISTAKNEVGNQEDESLKPSHDSNRGNHHNKERESLGETSADSLHPDIKALAELVENQNVENDNDSCGLRGRYYEQYTRLRDAKLMEGQDTKRAERDAKLRSMEETLIKRKAEMDAQTARLCRNVNNQSRILKLQGLKSDHSLKLDQKDADNDCGTLTSRDQKISGSGSRSPPVISYTIKEEITTSRLQVDRKSGTAQKAIVHPHTSTRSNQSISPKLTRKGTTGVMAIPRRSTVSSPIENPLARSVPNLNLTNFKKNTKPSTGRQSGSARVHPKNGANEGDRSAREAIHFDINANHSTNTLDRSTKNDKNSSRSNLIRKSCVIASDLKVLSTSSDDGTLRHVKSQRDFGTDSKLRRSGVGSFQENKQFLRKGSSVGQGAKSGVNNNKLHSAVTDAVKSSNEEEATIEIKQQSIAADSAHNMNDPGNLGDTEVENMETDATNDADVSPDSASSDDVEMQVVGSGNDSSDEPEEKPEIPSYPLVIGLLEEKTLSKDIFSSEGKCHDTATNVDTNSMLDMGVLGLRHEEDIVVKSPKRQTTVNDATKDTTFQNFTCIPKLPESPPTSGLVRSRTGSGHMSPFSAASLDSPIRSPTSNSFQTQYASGSDSIQLNKKWVGSPKSLSTLKQPKEQAKGFKRLLKFGRKSRNFEAASADYVSTISEGSCALEEKGQTPDEYSSSRGRFQDSIKMAGDLYNLQDRSFQNVKSSIPIPPANFSLREDHLSGGTMLKAPWSFFSLSALRSKGNESKPR